MCVCCVLDEEFDEAILEQVHVVCVCDSACTVRASVYFYMVVTDIRGVSILQ